MTVLDNISEDFNIINKLARAIKDHPYFTGSVEYRLRKKLAKHKNRADIPDKNLFVPNLGLGEAAKLNLGTSVETVTSGGETPHSECLPASFCVMIKFTLMN